MPSSDPTILFVPGLRDHVEDHWQTHAARECAGSMTVEPLQADRLSRAARVGVLDAAIEAIPGDVVLVAHSAGCLTVAHWAVAPSRRIRAALMVTPAEIESPLPAGYPSLADLEEGGWLPIPRKPLPFPTIVVGSSNDPLARLAWVEQLAAAWEATFCHAGPVGHLNPAAGFGPWEQFPEFLQKMYARVHEYTQNVAG